MNIKKLNAIACQLLNTISTGGPAPSVDILKLIFFHKRISEGKNGSFVIEFSDKKLKNTPAPIIIDAGTIQPIEERESLKVWGKHIAKELAYIKLILSLKD